MDDKTYSEYTIYWIETDDLSPRTFRNAGSAEAYAIATLEELTENYGIKMSWMLKYREVTVKRDDWN